MKHCGYLDPKHNNNYIIVLLQIKSEEKKETAVIEHVVSSYGIWLATVLKAWYFQIWHSVINTLRCTYPIAEHDGHSGESLYSHSCEQVCVWGEGGRDKGGGRPQKLKIPSTVISQ